MPEERASSRNKASKVTQIAEAIRADIASGKLQPGDALPPESILTTQFDVSQHTMRAALRVLQSDGLLRVQLGAGGGPRVQELDIDVLAERAGFYLQLQGADLADLLQVLLLLQPGAAELAARRRTDENLANLRACVAAAEAASTMSEFSEVAADFVVLLLEASNSPSIKLFGLLIRSVIHTELHRYLDDQVADADGIQFNARRFGEVVDLIELGEGEAAAALWRAHMLVTMGPDLKEQRTDSTPAVAPVSSC